MLFLAWFETRTPPEQQPVEEIKEANRESRNIKGKETEKRSEEKRWKKEREKGRTGGRQWWRSVDNEI